MYRSSLIVPLAIVAVAQPPLAVAQSAPGGCALGGTVTAGVVPLPGVVVSLTTDDGQLVDSTSTGTDGRCALEAMRTGHGWAAVYDPDDCSESQRFGQQLLDTGSNGILYRSVREPDGECLVCFRPRLVSNVSVAGHYEDRWSGRPEPVVTRLQK